MTRREVLSLLSAAGLLAVVTPARAGAAPAQAGATPGTGPGTAAAGTGPLLANTVALYAGTGDSNARPEVAAKLADIERTARGRLAAMDGAGGGELFAGVPLGTSDANLTTSYRGLYEIALATRTPGGGLYGDTPTAARVRDGLAWLYDRYYGDQSAGYYGNWFNWEIGISSHVSRALALLADVADPELVRTYVAAMDAYLRNGVDGDVDLDSRFHTGANLADITTNRMLQGALLGDEARIRKAIEDQLTVFATIDPYRLRHGVTDGYYADGSFIQHHSVAYTGSYGKALLSRVVQTLKLLDGTGYADTAALVPAVRRWITDGFAPVIFEGWMMEIVKGRAVSRTTTGYADVAVVVEAVVDLADYAADAGPLRSYVKHLRATSRAPLNPTSFVSPLSIVRYAAIAADDTVAPADLNPAARSVAYHAMDRHVHRRPGYAFALARSSERISRYEYMNSENLMPWFQGDGAHHLYLAGQDQTRAYGVDYYATVPPYRLAGVIAPVEERKTIPQLYGTPYYDNPQHPLGFTPSSESQNTYVYFPRGTNRYSGGATLAGYGATGMVLADDVPYTAKEAGLLPEDFVVYRNARATRSWFMFDDEIVVLAAGVGDPAGRTVTATVDTRIAAATDQLDVTGADADGVPWSGTGTAALRWLRYANTTQGTAVGYAFLDCPPVTVWRERVSRSLRVVRAANPDTTVTRDVFGVTVERPAGAVPAALAYALVPHATPGALAAYRDGPVTVLANHTGLQGVRHAGLGITAGNSFTPGRHELAGFSVDGPASLLARRRLGGLVTVAVADPTTVRDTVPVLVRGVRLTAVDADEGVRVSPADGGTLLEFRTHQRYGRSLTVTLRG